MSARNVSVKDKVAILAQLARLRDKTLAASELGSGNLELCNAISMLMAAVFFDVFADLDVQDRMSLSAVMVQPTRLTDSNRFRSILAKEAILLPRDRERSLL